MEAHACRAPGLLARIAYGRRQSGIGRKIQGERDPALCDDFAGGTGRSLVGRIWARNFPERGGKSIAAGRYAVRRVSRNGIVLSDPDLNIN